jgi:hypothetical protein
MNANIKPLVTSEKSPPWWTVFLDGTSPASFSYARVSGGLVLLVFLGLTVYLSITTGTLVIPSQEWVYILIAFALGKPVQRYAEAKDNESQLNYEFQMAQLAMEKSSTPPTASSKKLS